MCNSKPKVVTVQEPAPQTNTNSNNLGSGSSSNSTTTPAPTPEPVQESGSAMKKYRKTGLAGRNTNTGARGLGTNADSAKKELLGG